MPSILGLKTMNLSGNTLTSEEFQKMSFSSLINTGKMTGAMTQRVSTTRMRWVPLSVAVARKIFNLRPEGGNDFRPRPLLIEVRDFSTDFYERRSFFFYRQGCYSNEGDIVVLCAYLGQLARLRDALASKVAVVIDERDQVALDDQEGDIDQQTPGEVSIERVNVTKRVCVLCHMLKSS